MLNYTLLQPVGVCGLISPWNVPLMTATWKVAPCLALGNTAVLKMSELSPMTADRLGRLALEAGVPKGVLNIVHGHGSEAGDALVRHPDVRTISFTGGTATGQRIAERAGIKRLSMELGGKSPVLVFEDADQQRALDAALFTIFSINGERCTAGSRVFVQRSIYDRFAREFAERAARLIVGDPRDPDTNVGSMITRQHWEKVTGYIEIGRREGAVVAAGGGVPAGLPARVAKGNFVQPTVLTGVDNRMRVAQEEIFGPVVCLIPSTTRTRACGWPTTAATGWLPTSGPRTWARPTGWRAASRPAWSSSTARTCATCASPSAASGLGRGPRGRRRQPGDLLRDEERLHLDGQPPHSALGRVTPGAARPTLPDPAARGRAAARQPYNPEAYKNDRHTPRENVAKQANGPARHVAVETWLPQGEQAAYLRSLSHLGQPVTLPSGASLFNQGQVDDLFYVIVTGKVHVHMLSEDGHESILNIMGPGSLIGEAAAFLKQPRYSSARAIEDSSCCASRPDASPTWCGRTLISRWP